MRINLNLFANNPKDGYTNADGVFIITNQCENGEATEILSENVLEYIPLDHYFGTISNWLSKLRHNGKLIIVTQDIYGLTRKYLNGELNLGEYNLAMFGSSSAPAQKRSGVSMHELKQLVKQVGLTLEKSYFSDNNITLILRRP
jgi:hypothetical protein